MHYPPLLSVIVPVYKVEDYLPQAIDSILAQSYQHLEIILVDDGSPDACGQICDEYALRDERIKVIHKENGGLSSARNAGMAIMRGEYVAFVDSDDWLQPDAYATLMDAFAQDDSLDVARAEYYEVYPDKTIEHEPQGLEARTLEGIEALELLRKGEDFLAVVWSSVYRVSSLRSIELTFQEGLYHEDEYFTTVLYGCLPDFRLRYIPRPIYNYRKERAGAITSKVSLRNLRDLLRGYQAVYQAYDKYAPHHLRYINSYTYRQIEYLTIAILSSMYSWAELNAELRPFFERTRKYPLLGNAEDRWLMSIFRLSPRLSYYWGLVYQPIARRLGFSKRYT